MRARREVLAVLFLVAGLAACSSDPEPAPAASGSDIDGVEVYTDLSRDHTSDDVDYEQTPPVRARAQAASTRSAP